MEPFNANVTEKLLGRDLLPPPPTKNSDACAGVRVVEEDQKNMNIVNITGTFFRWTKQDLNNIHSQMSPGCFPCSHVDFRREGGSTIYFVGSSEILALGSVCPLSLTQPESDAIVVLSKIVCVKKTESEQQNFIQTRTSSSVIINSRRLRILKFN